MQETAGLSGDIALLCRGQSPTRIAPQDSNVTIIVMPARIKQEMRHAA